jgi:hypothetical protein
MPLDEPLHDSLHPVSCTLGAALAAIVVAISLVCCTRQPEPARHTVDEYRANPALRREQFARCSNDPGALRDTPDCTNVRQATLLEDSQSVRDLPPVRLPLPPNQPPSSRE